MGWAALINVLIYGGLIIIALLSWFIWDKRYRKGNGVQIPEGFEQTSEIFIDPANGKRLRVYYHPKTGERFYLEEQGE